MGALFGGNADRQWGYKIGDKIVPPSIDRIDGGGPGRSGPRFEGGGLLSAIGNAMMRPYGYRDRQAALQAVRPNARPQGLLQVAPAPVTKRRPDYITNEDQAMRQPLGTSYYEDQVMRQPLGTSYYEDQVMAQGLPSRLPAGLPREIIMTPEMHSFLRARFPERQLSPIGSLMDPSEISSIRNLRGASYDRPRVPGSEGAFPAAGTPAASLSAAEDPLLTYMLSEGVPADVARSIAAGEDAFLSGPVRRQFETANRLGVRTLTMLRNKR